MKLVDIIVIGFNLKKLEATCLSSIIFHTKCAFKLTFFDNYNSGFTLTQIWNKLIKESTCKYICLLNNDTEVTKNWLNKLVDTLEKDSTIGVVGPSTNNCHSIQSTIKTPEEAEKHAGVKLVKEPISGFCLLFKKSLWDQLDGFDEQFTLYGQESDFIKRAENSGFKIAWRRDAFVWHHGESSIKSSNMNVESERQKARDRYWKKHG